jgi:hypothetical protein
VKTKAQFQRQQIYLTNRQILSLRSVINRIQVEFIHIMIVIHHQIKKTMTLIVRTVKKPLIAKNLERILFQSEANEFWSLSLRSLWEDWSVPSARNSMEEVRLLSRRRESMESLLSEATYTNISIYSVCSYFFLIIILILISSLF